MNVPLSPLGKEEAKAAAVYLQDFSLDHVFASTLDRAIYGAEQVHLLQKPHESSSAVEDASSSSSTNDTSNHHLPDVVCIEGLKELDRGAWCGKTKDEIGADMLARFDACDDSVTPEGGESYRQLYQRVLHARDTEILPRIHPGDMAAVVSHLQVTRCIVLDALQMSLPEITSVSVATASVTCVDYEADGTQTIHYRSFKPEAGLEKAKDGAN
jgi:broad specificity phosphatase PhoE